MDLACGWVRGIQWGSAGLTRVDDVVNVVLSPVSTQVIAKHATLN
jgi:hypothetical protein